MLVVFLKKRISRQQCENQLISMPGGTVLQCQTVQWFIRTVGIGLANREMLSTLYYLFQYVDLSAAKLKYSYIGLTKEIKHISLFLLIFQHMNAYICMYVYMDLYIHIYTCKYAVRPVCFGCFCMNSIIKLEHSYLQKMEIVLVDNLMQVLLKINMIHFSIMHPTELSLCVVLL